MSKASKPTEFMLRGQLLIAMPGMPDARFAGTVSLICYHNEHGAMAVVLNRLIGTMKAEQILEKLETSIHWPGETMHVHLGGPMLSDRGFIIHGAGMKHDDSQPITPDLRISATTDVLLQLLIQGRTPWRLAIGCASWVPGQLEDEIREGGWLTAPATPDLVFQPEIATLREQVLRRIGVRQPAMLVAESGRA